MTLQRRRMHWGKTDILHSALSRPLRILKNTTVCQTRWIADLCVLQMHVWSHQMRVSFESVLSIDLTNFDLRQRIHDTRSFPSDIELRDIVFVFAFFATCLWNAKNVFRVCVDCFPQSSFYARVLLDCKQLSNQFWVFTPCEKFGVLCSLAYCLKWPWPATYSHQKICICFLVKKIRVARITSSAFRNGIFYQPRQMANCHGKATVARCLWIFGGKCHLKCTSGFGTAHKNTSLSHSQKPFMHTKLSLNCLSFYHVRFPDWIVHSEGQRLIGAAVEVMASWNATFLEKILCEEQVRRAKKRGVQSRRSGNRSRQKRLAKLRKVQRRASQTKGFPVL